MPQNQLKMEYIGKVWNFMEKFGWKLIFDL
jgi:hypothetical protein